MGILILSILLLFSTPQDQQYNFTSAEKEQLHNGEVVVREEKIEGMPWPKTTSYTFVEISPLDGLAIFSDFKAQQNYIPRVMESGVKEYKKPWEIYASIKAEVPWPVNESNYTTGNILEHPNENHYRLIWYFVEAEHFNDTYGYISFHPFKGKTLMVYNSFVEPMTPFLAKLFQGKVRSENLEVVKAIRDHLNSFEGKSSDYLNTRREKVKAALREKEKN
ncbi:MAG: hypothetical protein WD048_01295 [Chitinophagales bacterium]